MKLPVSVRSVYKIGRQIKDELTHGVKIVLVGESASRLQSLVDVLADTEDARKIFHIFECKDNDFSPGFVKATMDSDLIVVVAEKHKLFDKETAFLISFVSQLERPYLLAVDGILDSASRRVTIEQVRKAFGVTANNVAFVSTKRGSGFKELAQKLVSNCGKKEVALGARVPLLKTAACNEVIRKSAMENGVIGLLTFLPGADMPIMTANQMRMVLRIALIYNQRIDVARLKELVAVLGSGVTFRAIARQILSFVPGPGWVFKSTIAYGGTVALGKATTEYFQNGLNNLTVRDVQEILSKND